jgi:hypothetical protein
MYKQIDYKVDKENCILVTHVLISKEIQVVLVYFHRSPYVTLPGIHTSKSLTETNKPNMLDISCSVRDRQNPLNQRLDFSAKPPVNHVRGEEKQSAIPCNQLIKVSN